MLISTGFLYGGECILTVTYQQFRNGFIWTNIVQINKFAFYYNQLSALIPIKMKTSNTAFTDHCLGKGESEGSVTPSCVPTSL